MTTSVDKSTPFWRIDALTKEQELPEWTWFDNEEKAKAFVQLCHDRGIAEAIVISSYSGIDGRLGWRVVEDSISGRWNEENKWPPDFYSWTVLMPFDGHWRKGFFYDFFGFHMEGHKDAIIHFNRAVTRDEVLRFILNDIGMDRLPDKSGYGLHRLHKWSEATEQPIGRRPAEGASFDFDKSMELGISVEIERDKNDHL